MPPLILEVAPYLAGLTGGGLTLFLALEMRRMQREFQARWNKRQQTMLSELGRLRGIVEDLEARLAELERMDQAEAQPGARLVGINLNRRAQAIRLFRRGEHPEQVAGSMGIPRRDADLLWKVHRILATEPGRQSSLDRQATGSASETRQVSTIPEIGPPITSDRRWGPGS